MKKNENNNNNTFYRGKYKGLISLIFKQNNIRSMYLFMF